MGGDSLLMKFKKEVSNLGAEACLPANLSDDWIDYLDGELRSLGNSSGVEIENFHPVCALAAIVTILSAKYREGKVEIPFDNLIENMNYYRIEIGLEVVSRRSDIKYGPATLENILTKRTIECWKV